MSAAPRPQPVYPGSKLTRTAFAGALANLYFGPGDPKDRFGRFIRRAYRDMNRTIRGLGALDGQRREALRRQGEEVLRHHLIALAQSAATPSAKGFDEWHRGTCEALIGAYQDHSIHLSVGQAQKWVNMTLKYVFVADALDVTPIAQLRPFYCFAHMPIDNVVLDALAAMEPPTPAYARPWSRQDSYDEYLDFQRAVRERFGCGLDGEFMVWRPHFER